MIEGKIIKFYREKANLRQAELCNEICSVTHLSKIERGITEYSPEITILLAKRLTINLEAEIIRYHQSSQKLNQWLEAMIMQREGDSRSLKEELEQERLIGMPEFQVVFQLLSARYYLFEQNLELAFKMIQNLQKQEADLSPQNQNTLKHILGIYHFLKGQYRDCIACLTSINPEQYSNEEYYYHLALAYHAIHSNITAYYYGKKALSFFQRKLNIIRIIDTEMLLIVQLNAKELHDFVETKAKYEQLIKLSESLHSKDRIGKIFHNLGFECYRRKMYKESADYYQKAIDLLGEASPHYLSSLDGYIHTCYSGKLYSEATLIPLAEKGMKQAKSSNAPTWIDFQLHLYELTKQKEKYYQFVEETIIPHYKEIGYVILIDHYERKLFQYNLEKGNKAKALELASKYINSKKSFYNYE
ncbi:helix-turn-helix transcriptional regulator [Bacillus sp. JJ1122]|uniref:helix-turn-helix domain-containing protein n=1 Tax=Bacillus sp. JJ1122 TaxID=3122951 RepID=UPI002FFFD175